MNSSDLCASLIDSNRAVTALGKSCLELDMTMILDVVVFDVAIVVREADFEVRIERVD